VWWVGHQAKHPDPTKIKIIKPLIKAQNVHRHRQELRKGRIIFEFRTWNVKTPYRNGKVTTSILQLRKYELQVTAVPEAKWNYGSEKSYCAL